MSFAAYPKSLPLIPGLENSTAGAKLPVGFAYTVKYWVPVDATAATDVVLALLTGEDYEELRRISVNIGEDLIIGEFEVSCRKSPCPIFLVQNIDPTNPTFTVPQVPYNNLTLIPTC
jgi:hypothetical protein